MIRFVVRRLLQMCVVVVVLSMLVFLWLRSLPGGPVSAILGECQTPERVAALARPKALSGTSGLLPDLPDVRGTFRTSFSPDGRRLLACSAYAPPTLHDAQTGKAIAILSADGDDATFKPGLVVTQRETVDARFTPDGRHVVRTMHGTRVWSASEGKPLTATLRNTDEVGTGRVSPDGQRLATVTGQEVRLWGAAAGEAAYALGATIAALLTS